VEGGRYAILDHVLEGCQVISPDWRYLYVNAAAASQRCLHPETMLGRQMSEVASPIEQGPVLVILQRCMRDRVAEQIEQEVALSDGERRWFELRVQPVPEGLLILSWDITARRRTEAALRESEQRYRELFDDAPIGYHEIDRNGIIVRVNPTEARQLGYRVEEMLGRPVWEFILERQESERAVREKISGHRPLQAFERRYVRKDGTTVDLYIHEHFIRDATGQVVGIRSVVTDITARKRAEEALRESQRALMTLLSNLPGMAYRCRNDTEWTMEFVSEGCVELTGYQPADLVGNRKISYAQLIHRDDRDMVWREVQLALQENRPFQLTYRIVTARGEEKWVWEQGRGVSAPAGELTALEGFIIDITERRRAEEALRRSEQRYRELAERLEHDASHDPLTGCYNRGFLRNILESEVSRAARHKRPLTLALMDVDRMKAVNDNFGHEVGDAVLCRLVQVVMRAKRGADSLARWGGDEFVLIMPDTSAAQAQSPMQRIQEMFHEELAEGVGVPRDVAALGVAVSVGVVEYEAGETVADLLRRADALMYADKRRKK